MALMQIFNEININGDHPKFQKEFYHPSDLSKWLEPNETIENLKGNQMDDGSEFLIIYKKRWRTLKTKIRVIKNNRFDYFEMTVKTHYDNPLDNDKFEVNLKFRTMKISDTSTLVKTEITFPDVDFLFSTFFNWKKNSYSRTIAEEMNKYKLKLEEILASQP